MTLEEINARIAQLEQNIAEKKAYQRMYRPGKATATWDYVAEGDRSGLDNIHNEETAYHNMLRQQEQQNRMLKAQQEFTAEQNRLSRQNALDLAREQKEDQQRYVNNEVANKYQLALTDYELAQQQVDMQKPETLARLKRAAQMVNYYGSQLNFDPVSLEATGDSPAIKVNKNISKVKALLRLDPKKWSAEQKQEYVDTMALIPDEDERKSELVVSGMNKGPTTDELELSEFNKLQEKIDSRKNLTTKERTRYNTLSKKFSK